MDKTLQDISKEHNAKTPAIYARLKKLEASNPDKKLSYKKANVLYLTKTGLKLLEANLKDNPIKEVKPNKATEGKTDSYSIELDKTLIEGFKSQIEVLERQLEAKDKTISELISVMANLSSNLNQSLTESHSLLSQRQTIEALEISEKSSNNAKKEPVFSGIPVSNAPTRKKKLASKMVIAFKLFRGDYD